MKSDASLPRNIEPFGERDLAHSVNDAEVDGLGAPPHLVGDAVRRHAEHLHGGSHVHVLPGAKRVHEHGILGKMGEHAKLDLRVVGADDAHPARGHERPPNRAAEIAADGDVLQVRVVGRDATRRRHGLAPFGVDAAGRGVDEPRERVDVGALELRELAVLEQDAGKRVMLGQLLEHVGVRRTRGLGAFDRLQAELVEQDDLELARRIDVELAPGQLPRALFQPLDVRGRRSCGADRARRDRRKRRSVPSLPGPEKEATRFRPSPGKPPDGQLAGGAVRRAATPPPRWPPRDGLPPPPRSRRNRAGRRASARSLDRRWKGFRRARVWRWRKARATPRGRAGSSRSSRRTSDRRASCRAARARLRCT